MKPLIPIMLFCLIIGVLLGSGCSTPTPPITPTPTQTTSQSTTAPTSTIPPPTTSPVPSLTPGPTVTVPAGFDTNVGITWNDVTRTIFIQYNGGMSQILLQRIDVRITTATKRVLIYSKTNEEGQISTGDIFKIQGDRGVNRVEVTVTINGISYKIVDTIVLFK
ncbi:MAG: hypothetical protein LUP99_04755 [Methanomicrobiales archaeon]|nr:hypothetical protein [Methanomicrobiales archaeon]